MQEEFNTINYFIIPSRSKGYIPKIKIIPRISEFTVFWGLGVQIKLFCSSSSSLEHNAKVQFLVDLEVHIL